MNILKRLNLMPMMEEDGGTDGVGEALGETETADFDEAFDDAFSFEGDAEDTKPAEEKEEAEGKPAEEEPAGDTKPAEEAETKPQTVKINHNGQEMELTQEQLIKAAQQGMDYDRVRESRERFKAPIERLAQQAGMATDQFLNALDGMIKANGIETKKAQFIQQGIDERLAGQMAKMAWENEQLKAGRQHQEQSENARAQARQQVQAKIQGEIAAFEAKFPKVETLPDEVVTEIKGGASPIEAYQNHLIRQRESELKELRQKQKNTESLPGGAKGKGAAKPDVFEEGFDIGMRG